MDPQIKAELTALGRSRRGPSTGGGCFAILFVIALLGVMGGVALTELGLRDEPVAAVPLDRDSTSLPPAGTCILGYEGRDPIPIDCAEPHKFEIAGIWTVTRPSDDFPGKDRLSEFARKHCQDVGRAYFDGNTFPEDTAVVPALPNEEEWIAEEREVWCLVFTKPVDDLYTGRLWPGAAP